jgi:hypothetical protein
MKHLLLSEDVPITSSGNKYRMFCNNKRALINVKTERTKKNLMEKCLLEYCLSSVHIVLFLRLSVNEIFRS